jgi:hypothetical protein
MRYERDEFNMGKMIDEFKEFALKGNVVDMAIGVVADERAVLQPYDALGTQPLLQPFFYLLL